MDLNPAAEVFFGIKADKAAGRVFDDAIRDWPELAAAIREKNAKHCELISGERHYEAYISDLIDGRKAAGYIVVIQDVTANKAIQRQLIQHQHAM
jgi:PAS domain-containing protein